MIWREYLEEKQGCSKRYQLYKARKENPDYVWTKWRKFWTFFFLFFWYPFTFIKWINVEVIGDNWILIIIVLIFLAILGGVIAFIVINFNTIKMLVSIVLALVVFFIVLKAWLSS
ncbi:hypothetical protein [Mycoplasma yeatsii]|uniref:hypothetical protein n=1 Tax=Mycoplasma yeatsii TaxID=51365 RepID=UPI0005B244D4|nr:hypothetical protein [Mycoplasma yeatsii]AJM71567.1 hypothetical protein MYE_00345 [Mycoplasma yeatsii GM274B]